MSHDDSSGRAGSPLITQPSTGWVGWAVEQTESVLRAIPALLCNAPYPQEPAQGGTRYAIIPPLHGRRKSRDRHPDPREVAVSDHNRQDNHISPSPAMSTDVAAERDSQPAQRDELAHSHIVPTRGGVSPPTNVTPPTVTTRVFGSLQQC